MTGLEHILQTYNISKSEISSRLGVSKVNITFWCQGKRKIPNNRIFQLKNLFPNVPETYFSKVFTETETRYIFQKQIECIDTLSK